MEFSLNKYLEKACWYTLCHFIKYEGDFLYRNSNRRFIKNMMDPAFDIKKIKGFNPYFLKWGYKFPLYESVYYSQQTGVESDLYLPIGLYNDYIFPYLDHDAWHYGYADKNMFARLLDVENAQKYVDVLIPEYVVYCDNGRFFQKGDIICTKKEAINAVINFNDTFIIKPTVVSHHGDGVKVVKKDDINSANIEKLFDEYGNNFTIQKLIIQHPDLASFNSTSVNTIRITTYQDPRGNVKVLYATQRFGSTGQVTDNANNTHGGGLIGIDDDGTYKRKIHHYRSMQTDTMDNNLPAKVPCYEKIKDCVKFMHTRFPHFGIIGWDVTVTPEGHPLIIEYNFRPDFGGAQLANGPFFSKEDLDEIMEGISKCRIIPMKKKRVVFANRPSYWAENYW